jgi:hypothetical protein
MNAVEDSSDLTQMCCDATCDGHSDKNDGGFGFGFPSHTMPCEAGGITMIELVYAMKSDASDQEKLIGIFSEMLDETVERNDCLQVFSFQANGSMIDLNFCFLSFSILEYFLDCSEF